VTRRMPIPEWPDFVGVHPKSTRPYERLCFVPWCPNRTRVFYGEKPLCGRHAEQQARQATAEAARVGVKA
jgi:hypothetical protein